MTGREVIAEITALNLLDIEVMTYQERSGYYARIATIKILPKDAAERRYTKSAEHNDKDLMIAIF